MKKGYLGFLVILSLFLVSGPTCESNKGKEGVFFGGSQGLVIDFIDDAPPLSGNFQNQLFPIDLEVINKGETEIQKNGAHIYLTGALYSSSAVVVDGITPDKHTTNNEFISSVEEGEEGVVEDSVVLSLGNAKYTGSILGDSVPLDVRANICYPYKTKVQVDDFCVPSTVRTTTLSEECEIDTTVNLIGDKDNSGAPVHVTSVREQKGPDFVRVTLDINNVGSGEVVNACSRDISREALNDVTVTMPANYACSFKDGTITNRGAVELRNGHAVLRCKRNVNNSGSAFKEALAVTLDYYYMQEVSKTVTINKA